MRFAIRVGAAMLLFGLSVCAQQLTLSPSKVSFRFEEDGPVPDPVRVSISSPAGAVKFAFVLDGVVPGGLRGPCMSFTPWESPADRIVYPAEGYEGVTPATVLVYPFGQMGKPPGWYCSATASLYVLGESSSRVRVYQGEFGDIEVTPPPPPTVRAIANTATARIGPAAPGEIAAVLGANLAGAKDPLGAVTFDGVPARVLWWTAAQLNVIVPYEVSGRKQSEVVVTRYGKKGVPFLADVADTSPGIFTNDYTGDGQANIQNQDGPYNDEFTPAARGSVIQIYGTGAGVMTPAPVPGQYVFTEPYPKPLAPVTVKVGGLPAAVQYAGQAPRMMSGVVQVNAVLPDGVDGGPQPVELIIGNNSNSAQKATVVVRHADKATLQATARSVNLTFPGGSATMPAPRAVDISSTLGSGPFTAKLTYWAVSEPLKDIPDCLVVSPTAGTLPARLTISTGLPPAVLAKLKTWEGCSAYLDVRAPNQDSLRIRLEVSPEIPAIGN